MAKSSAEEKQMEEERTMDNTLARHEKVKKKKHRDHIEEVEDATSSVKKHSKEKKKKRDRQPDVDGVSQSGAKPSLAIQPGQETTSTEHKKKKRKHDEHGDNDGPPTAGGVERHKKKKKQKEGAEKAAQPVSVDVSESIEQADGDRVHKKKKKRRIDESGARADDAKEPEVIPSPEHAALAQSSKENGSSAEPSAAAISDYLSKHDISMDPPTDTPSLILSFAQLDTHIPPELRHKAFGTFKEPTPVQASTWPNALSGRDMVGIAETGSGKTLAFGIPALARLHAIPPKTLKKSSSVRVLVVAPTRELAIQTHDTFLALDAQSVAVFGGVDKAAQVKALAGKGAHIVVGTPGRILDLANEGACDLSGVEYLVLDEADRMLDKGFENDIRSIIGMTKQGEERQTLMFSATWPEAVRRLASTFLRKPVRVTVGSEDLTANSRVEQFVEVFDDERSKDQRLLGHLRKIFPNKPSKAFDANRVLVFALYKKEASRVCNNLESQGFSVGALHGDMSQSARLEALDNFKTGKTTLLVATDVAARGLDIPNVGVVINYTFPLTVEDYVHRIGRTGRGGRTGKSITFFTGANHERSLAGEFARILRDGGFDKEVPKLSEKFPMTIKKKTHSVYGAFFREDVGPPKVPTKIKF